jgi:hypothetical protein
VRPFQLGRRRPLHPYRASRPLQPTPTPVQLGTGSGRVYGTAGGRELQPAGRLREPISAEGSAVERVEGLAANRLVPWVTLVARVVVDQDLSGPELVEIRCGELVRAAG